MTDHTPTPWYVMQSGFIMTNDVNAGTIAKVCGFPDPEAVANATLLTRAVNAHDELVEALNACQKELGITPGFCPIGVDHRLVNNIDAALKHATKGV